MKNMYYLTITNEHEKLSGYLSNTSFDDNSNCFNPLTVLGELANTVFAYKEIGEWTHENYFFKETYKMHPFFKFQSICRNIDTFIRERMNNEVYQFGHPLAGTMASINSFIVAFDRLHECFLLQNSLSMSDFELIKAMNQFKFTFEVERGEKIQRASKNRSATYEYIPVYYGTHITPTSWQEYQNENKEPVRFVYTCYSLEEVLFAVWHYLIFHGYIKFNQCHHCNTYFATKSLKTIYCTNMSPYEGYTHLNCEQAVRNIKQKLARRRKVIYRNLENDYHDDILTGFINQCDDFNSAITDRSSIENLKAYEHFLDKETVKNTWYTAENKAKKYLTV